MFYARIVTPNRGVGLFQVAMGPRPQGAFLVHIPRKMIDLPVDARFDVALFDARGCERCTAGSWRWAIYPPVPLVEAYP